jgi:transcriptional regulator with XRE-family HTH domain
VQAELAANVRRLRIARGVSLSELARATGIAKGTLSAVENGRANPTVSTLTALSGALGVLVGELLEPPALGEIRVVRRRSDGVVGTIDFAGPADARELVLSAGQLDQVEPRAAGARDELFVVEGTLIAGPAERITELGAGDYASFPADVPRTYETRRRGARALLLSH